MTHGGNDFLNALWGRQCTRIPYQEPVVSRAHVEAILGRAVAGDSTDLPVEDYVEFTVATGQSALYHNALWKAGRVYQADGGGRLHYTGGRVRTRADFARLKPFDVGASVERIAALTAAAAPRGLAVMVSFPSPFRLAMYAMGYEEFFLRLHDDRAFLAALIEHFRGPAEQYLRALLEYPVDAFLLAGTICSGSGPLMSPGVVRDTWLPDAARFLGPVVEKDIPVVLHMDGDFSRVADLLAELPIAAIHPFEVTGALDIYAFKRQFGDRIAVWGNIDLATVLTRGTPDEVREDVRRHIQRLGPGGRYILGSSHEITPDVPVENFRALVDAARSGGRT